MGNLFHHIDWILLQDIKQEEELLLGTFMVFELFTVYCWSASGPIISIGKLSKSPKVFDGFFFLFQTITMWIVNSRNFNERWNLKSDLLGNKQ